MLVNNPIMKEEKMKTLIGFLIAAVLIVLPLKGEEPVGTIQGKVAEYLRSTVIPGTQVQIMNTRFSTITNAKGQFKLLNLPVGSYTVKFSVAGFKPFISTDIIVRPNRITFLHIELREQRLQLTEKVKVTAGYFSKNEEVPHSVLNLSKEEVRRAPGTIGDVSRVLKAMPGVAGNGDETTDLIVRGGSPLENGFFIDNIEVPNINHLPRIGSTGGVLSGLNQDLVQNVDFFTGGFSANYGHRLSSITDITFREGNKEEFDGQLDINMVQAGGVMEGPLFSGNGSWLVSVKQSYLQLMKKAGILNVGAVPNTFDSQVKLTFDINAKHKINILNVFLKGDYQEEYDDGFTYEDNKYTQNTIGINWIANWSERFLSNTSLSYSFLNRNDGETNGYQTDTPWQWFADNSATYFALRNFNYLFFNNRNKCVFGFQVKYQSDEIDRYQDGYTNWMGDPVPDSWLKQSYKTINSSIFFSYIWQPLKRLTTTIGLRGDHWSAHQKLRMSPRLSFSYALTPRFSVNGGFGIYYQSLPMSLLAYWPQSKRLDHMRAAHYTFGLEFFPGAGTKITLEVYNKEYDHLPIDPFIPQGMVTDSLIDSYYVPLSVVSEGAGYSRGIELLVHKKLTRKFYGLISASFFRSRYKDMKDQWWNRFFDNRYLVNLGAGYKPNNKWEFSFKWTLVGGRPYTPFDTERSIAQRQAVYDQTRFMGARIPAYSSLNIRVDRRFYFGKSNLIVYLDVWNILNRKNVYEYEWDGFYQAPAGQHQLTILPMLGVEYEF